MDEVTSYDTVITCRERILLTFIPAEPLSPLKPGLPDGPCNNSADPLMHLYIEIKPFAS